MAERSQGQDARAEENPPSRRSVDLAAETQLDAPPAAPLCAPPLQLLHKGRSGAARLPTIPGYEILEELGHGGMGVVYRARHVRLDRIVAVKMIRAGDFADAEDVARFIAEAQVVASLQHPSIVQLYEIGEHEGRPYFSLEYVAGGTLADAVRGVPQPAQVAAEFVEVLARAVDTAHRAGVIHRDLKPSNILLSEQRHADEQRSAQVAAGDTVDRPALALAPRAKVADFGL